VRPADTRDFFVELLGFEVAMDMGWVVTVASPTNPSAQVTIIGNDDMAAPGISVEVADVDAVHAKAVEQGFEIAYPLRDEEWGFGASCFASRAARSSTSYPIARADRVRSCRDSQVGLVGRESVHQLRQIAGQVPVEGLGDR
jgi:catechol 2,3-dioxygenase-like lactoylglutathione lyase family enzyme